MNPVTSNTLLTYSLTTVPNPLQVSPETGGSVSSDITLVISNDINDPSLQLTKVTFELPIGEDAADLTNDLASIHHTASPSGTWDIIQGASSGEFILQSKSGGPVTITKDGIVVQFFGIRVNQKVGTFPLAANELAQGTGAPLQLRQALFEVAKFPYGYFFSQFAASAPQVADGGTVTLTWAGSDLSSYTMFWADQHADVTDVRSWTSPALTTDTTFILQAQSVSQGETVTTSLSTTVIVANPELSATSLSVSGTANLQGNTTTAGLTVNGTLSGGTANFTSASANSFTGNSINLQGNATVASLNVNGPANITGGGNAVFSALQTNGLTANGPVQIIGALQHNYNYGREYTAVTDLFITANVSHGAVKSNEDKSYAVVGINTEGQYIWASGGNVAGPDKTYLSTNGACSAFIRKGQKYQLIVNQDSNNKVAAYYEFYLWPLGVTSTQSAASPEPEAVQEPRGRIDGTANSTLADVDTDSLAKHILKAVAEGDEKHLSAVLKRLLCGVVKDHDAL